MCFYDCFHACAGEEIKSYVIRCNAVRIFMDVVDFFFSSSLIGIIIFIIMMMALAVIIELTRGGRTSFCDGKEIEALLRFRSSFSLNISDEFLRKVLWH
jgi:hypothetical protein